MNLVNLQRGEQATSDCRQQQLSAALWLTTTTTLMKATFFSHFAHSHSNLYPHDAIILPSRNRHHTNWPLAARSINNIQIELNSLGNYLGKAWTPRDGCRHCNMTMISLASIKVSGIGTRRRRARLSSETAAVTPLTIGH